MKNLVDRIAEGIFAFTIVALWVACLAGIIWALS